MCVLYIAGAGRSGSTLLELILGNRSDFFSVGEVRYFWEYWQQGNRLCGCGQLLTTCPFWLGVHRRLQAERVDLSQMALLASRFDRTRNLMKMNWRDDRFFPSHFITATSQLYEAIQVESRAEVIVDSSKVPSHMYLLKQIPAVDLRVLHLVRDGRAVAYSWSKRQKRELGIQRMQAMPDQSLLKAIIVWMVENQFARFASAQTKRCTQLRYEDFVDDPVGQLGQVLNALGWPSMDVAHLGEVSFPIQATHSVGGNPLRFGQKELQIRADEAWRRQMPAWQQWALWLFALSTMRQYGYSLS